MSDNKSTQEELWGIHLNVRSQYKVNPVPNWLNPVQQENTAGKMGCAWFSHLESQTEPGN